MATQTAMLESTSVCTLHVSESDAKNDGSQPYWVFRKWGRTGVKLGDKTWRSTAPTRTGVKLSVSKPLEQITLNNSV